VVCAAVAAACRDEAGTAAREVPRVGRKKRREEEDGSLKPMDGRVWVVFEGILGSCSQSTKLRLAFIVWRTSGGKLPAAEAQGPHYGTYLYWYHTSQRSLVDRGTMSGFLLNVF
jgi:hypothetical protein